MDKKIVLAALLAFSTAAHADMLRVRALGGYTTFAMKELNASLDKQATAFESAGLTKKKDDRLGAGYMAGLEVASGLLIPLPFMEVALRGELVGGSSEYNYEGSAGQKATGKTDALLTNGLVGLVVGLDLPLTGLGLGLGAYGGYGYAVLKSSSASLIGASASASSAQYTGGGFVSELEAKLKYSIIPMVAVDLFGGMRFASISSMTDGSSTGALKDPVDFSGFNVGGGLTIGF